MKGLETKAVRDSIVVMTEMVLPSHTNSLDSVFGGTIMSWIDIAGAISAQRFSNKAVVTASIDDLHFVAPVYKGWVVNLKACVNYAARTSMEVGVRIDAENPITGGTFHTASAYLTFVALDSNGKPTPVPHAGINTAEERRRFDEAALRRKWRLQRRTAFRDR